MLTARQARSKTGYLDVKLPAKARGRGPRSWKAWKRRWVVLHGLHDLATGGIVITLDMYQNATVEGQQLERSTIYLETVTLLQRTRSRSHPYTFCIEAKQTVVYLAASCETDTQEWMDVFRNILWPPIEIQDFDAAFTEIYTVAVVDATFSTLFGIRGGACHLLISENLLQLCCNHRGHVLLEWPSNALARVYIATGLETRDQNRIFVIEPRPHFGGWTAPLHLFSPKAQEIVRTISSCIQQSNRSDPDRKSLASSSFLRKHSATKWNYLTKKNICVSNEDLTSMHSEILVAAATYDSPKSKEAFYQTPQRYVTAESLKSSPAGEGYYDLPKVCFGEIKSNSDIQQVEERKKTWNKRHSHSESELHREHKVDVRNRLSQSFTFDNLDKECDFLVQNTPENVHLRTTTARKDADEKLVSICSSISSRDSGVQVLQPDEMKYEKAKDQVECIAETGSETNSLLDECTPCEETMDDYSEKSVSIYDSPRCNAPVGTLTRRSFFDSNSSSNDDEIDIYSEIECNEYNASIIDEPMYEDLDRFRKDIHKMLGIPLGQCPKTSTNDDEENPPPLPPRCPRLALSPPNKVTGKKDVFQFLGIEDHFAKEMIRADQMQKHHVKQGIRRKDLFQYLGVQKSTSFQSGKESPHPPLRKRSTMPMTTTDAVSLQNVEKGSEEQKARKHKKSITKSIFRKFKDKDVTYKEPFPIPRSATLPKQFTCINVSDRHRLLSSNMSWTDISSRTFDLKTEFANLNSLQPTSEPNDDDLLLMRNMNLTETYPDFETEPIAESLDCDSEQINRIAESPDYRYLFIQFAENMYEEIWTQVRADLKTKLSEMVNNESTLAPDIPITVICEEFQSNLDSPDTNFDPVYMDMTPKTLEFLSIQRPSEEDTTYQNLTSRSISDSSYISLDWDGKRSSIREEVMKAMQSVQEAKAEQQEMEVDANRLNFKIHWGQRSDQVDYSNQVDDTRTASDTPTLGDRSILEAKVISRTNQEDQMIHGEEEEMDDVFLISGGMNTSKDVANNSSSSNLNGGHSARTKGRDRGQKNLSSDLEKGRDSEMGLIRVVEEEQIDFGIAHAISNKKHLIVQDTPNLLDFPSEDLPPPLAPEDFPSTLASEDLPPPLALEDFPPPLIPDDLPPPLVTENLSPPLLTEDIPPPIVPHDMLILEGKTIDGCNGGFNVSELLNAETNDSSFLLNCDPVENIHGTSKEQTTLDGNLPTELLIGTLEPPSEFGGTLLDLNASYTSNISDVPNEHLHSPDTNQDSSLDASPKLNLLELEASGMNVKGDESFPDFASILLKWKRNSISSVPNHLLKTGKEDM